MVEDGCSLLFHDQLSRLKKNLGLIQMLNLHLEAVYWNSQYEVHIDVSASEEGHH